MRPLVIGTRGSELAMWQARHVREGLLAAHPHLRIELSVIHTKGDKVLDVPLQALDKGMFTREIQTALLEKTADLAVHSLKDLPTDPVEGLSLAAVSQREDPADSLVSKGAAGLADLAPGATVMTGSPRRRGQLLHLRPDLKVIDVRGNIATRLRKLDESDAEAILLARAGLVRLGLAGRIACRLDPREFVPACGQGALGIEIRREDVELAGLLEALNDPLARLATAAERAFLKALGGGCKVPAGAYAAFENNTLTVTGMVADLDGRRLLRQSLTGRVSDIEAAEVIGLRLGNAILLAGGRDILKSAPGESKQGSEVDV